jgi:hypothetical protein
MRVVIAEDGVLLREGLNRLLADQDHEVIGSVGDALGLVEAVERERPDVCIGRRADAADVHRRGPARRDRDPRAGARHAGARPQPARRGALRDGAPRRRLGRSRLPAEAAGRRRARLPRRARPGVERRYGGAGSRRRGFARCSPFCLSSVFAMRETSGPTTRRRSPRRGRRPRDGARGLTMNRSTEAR